MIQNILDLDAIETAEKIRLKQLSIQQVVKTYIDHLKTVNPPLNALIEDRFLDAIEEAKQKDKQFPENPDKYPLYGVPITVKESFDVFDMKTTGGLKYLKNHRAQKDAQIITKLKKAGAIILGKTNTATLCYAQESVNKLYGRTNNPWDVTRTAGGSSGGEGALLAVGGAAAGVGSDIGGSIRLPSHFNGIYGFKSGKYTLTGKGHFPQVEHPLQQRMESFGPMGKSARDMKLLYEIMSEQELPDEPLHDMTINILPSDVEIPLSEQIKQLLDQVTEVLKPQLTVKREIPPYFFDSATIWQEIMSIDGSELIATLAFGKKPSTFTVVKSYLQEKLSQKTDHHAYLLWAILGSKLFQPKQEQIKIIKETIKAGDKQLKDLLAKELIIFPIYHSPAKPHGEVFSEIFSLKKTFQQYMPYLAYANVWGLPSLAIPLAKDEKNMPIGLQIIGNIGHESKIFSLAQQLEKHFTTYVRCKAYDQNSKNYLKKSLV